MAGWAYNNGHHEYGPCPGNPHCGEGDKAAGQVQSTKTHTEEEEDVCRREKRYLITLAHFESEILLRHQCMFEKLVSKLAAKYFRGGARLVEVGHLEWVLKVIPDPGSCLTLCFLV